MPLAKYASVHGWCGAVEYATGEARVESSRTDTPTHRPEYRWTLETLLALLHVRARRVVRPAACRNQEPWTRTEVGTEPSMRNQRSAINLHSYLPTI